MKCSGRIKKVLVRVRFMMGGGLNAESASKLKLRSSVRRHRSQQIGAAPDCREVVRRAAWD